MKLKRILAGALAGVMAITSSVVTSFTASAGEEEWTPAEGIVAEIDVTTAGGFYYTLVPNAEISADDISSVTQMKVTMIADDYAKYQLGYNSPSGWAQESTYVEASGGNAVTTIHDVTFNADSNYLQLGFDWINPGHTEITSIQFLNSAGDVVKDMVTTAAPYEGTVLKIPANSTWNWQGMEEFSLTGFSGTSLKDVAEEAGKMTVSFDVKGATSGSVSNYDVSKISYQINVNANYTSGDKTSYPWIVAGSSTLENGKATVTADLASAINALELPSGVTLEDVNFAGFRLVAMVALEDATETVALYHGDLTVTAEKALVTYKVNVDTAIENGTLTVTDEDGKAVTEAAEGTVIVIEAEAKEGYKLSGLTVNGVASEESFEMPAKDVTISAKFAPIEVETVTITPASATIVEGKTTTFAATVAPEEALDKTITWSSSDEKVATVDAKGVVTAVAAGKATITAKSANGKTATAEIKVSAEEIPATDLEVLSDGLTLYVGDESNIGAGASIEPANTTDTIIFTSSDTKIATVDEEGMVKAVTPGEAVIKVTTKLNDKLSVEVKVTVLDSGDYADGTWTQLSDEQLADVGKLNTITAVKDEYVTTENTLSLQYNATEKKLRIYKLLKAEDLKDKSGASIVVKKGNVALQLTTDCLYKTLAKGQEAPEGSYYVAWVIKDVENPADFSYSDIVLE